MAQKYLLVKEIPNWGGGSDEPQIPNDEIWYTSTDGKVVDLHNADDFGATYVSNTYSNGKGIIKFNGTITKVGNYAFYIDTEEEDITPRLKDVIIPNSVNTIGSHAFYNQYNMETINLTDNVTIIEDAAFKYATLRVAFVPKCTKQGMDSSGDDTGGEYQADGWFDTSRLESISVSPSHPTYDSRDNCNSVIHTETNALEVGSKNTVIPESVTKIMGGAFMCPIEHLTIPTNVTTIGGVAFNQCDKLLDITFESATPPTFLGDPIYECPLLTKIYVPKASESSYKKVSQLKNHLSKIVGK